MAEGGQKWAMGGHGCGKWAMDVESGPCGIWMLHIEPLCGQTATDRQKQVQSQYCLEFLLVEKRRGLYDDIMTCWGPYSVVWVTKMHPN